MTITCTKEGAKLALERIIIVDIRFDYGVQYDARSAGHIDANLNGVLV